jgi:hypothetical protein
VACSYYKLSNKNFKFLFACSFLNFRSVDYSLRTCVNVTFLSRNDLRNKAPDVETFRHELPLVVAMKFVIFAGHLVLLGQYTTYSYDALDLQVRCRFHRVNRNFKDHEGGVKTILTF